MPGLPLLRRQGDRAQQTASDLKDFGSAPGFAACSRTRGRPRYFGKVPQCDGMVEWKKSSKLTKPQLDDVADFVASFAAIPADRRPRNGSIARASPTTPASQPFQKECGTCHVIDGLSEGGTRDAPELFAWGSPQWIARMIHKPGAPDLYGYLEAKDQMPAFGADQLTENDVDDADPLPQERLHAAPESRPGPARKSKAGAR